VRYSYYIHLFSIFLLILEIFLGKTSFGSQRWLNLGPINIQPSEISKITFILVLSKFFSENVSPKAFKLQDLFVPFLFLVITFLLIYIQPDLGTAGIIVLLFISYFFLIKINKKSIIIMIISILCVAPLSWNFLKDYQKKRIIVFLKPELDPLHAGYQVIQSKIAIGSGGFWGKGFKLGTQNQLRFLPEQHTDFVFSVWAEEWGLVGSIILVLLYTFLLYKGITIAINSKNPSGLFLSIGIVFLFFLQIVINIGMTLGLLPVVGVPLPFFSYGGSSMITNMVAVGLLLNINMRKFKY